MSIRLFRTKTFCCVYHDLWGTRQELIAHHLKNDKKCAIVQQLILKNVANKKREKGKGMSPKRLATRKRMLLGDKA